MAGSLQRPPLKIIIPLHKCNNTSKYKSIIKYQKLRLLRTKRRQHHNSDKISRNSSYQNPRQLQQLLKQLKYCQSLSWNKLLLLLPSSLSASSVLYSNDSCWTATENKKQKYHKILAAAAAEEATAINYVQQQVQQQKQQQYQHFQYQQQRQLQQQERHEKQLQLPLLQILNKVFKSSKFCKNLLNRKKLQQLQLREIQFYRENQLNKKTF